jgi:hypothetical protein
MAAAQCAVGVTASYLLVQWCANSGPAVDSSLASSARWAPVSTVDPKSFTLKQTVCSLQIVMTASKFTSNIGDAGGGGLQCDGCTLLNATRSTFTSNNASAGGGGGLG